MNRDPHQQPERRSPLKLMFAKAAQASTRTKVAVAVIVALAFGMARLSYLQSEASAEQVATPVSTGAQAPQFYQTETAVTVGVTDDDLVAAQTAIGLEELPAPAVLQEDPPPPSFNSDDREQSSPDWIFALLGFGLAIIGGIKAGSWTEKNGYTMKRFEDWINKKSRKKKDKDDPAP